ncbi:DinB family protein [Nocardioides sp. SYSU DS0651]|uniref:DinB family protein n=1 Tax=Nocardioides sp. SYSU DS0651 TaxID=3415955 RepID=UPI003F4BDF26
MAERPLETLRQPVPRVDDGERATSLAFLAFARACVMKKVEGLGDDQLRRRHVVSDTTLIGLVQHLADSERYWFGHVLTGDPRYADVDFSMVVPEHRRAAEVVADYRAAIADSDRNLAGVALDDLTPVAAVDGRPRSVRWVVAHMTSEVARHAGHADILRELTDEVTGR